MEKEKLNKKQIIPLVIGVLTIIILVSSATYAYFRVSIGNTATSTTITGDIGGGTLGTITLDGGGTNLYLGVSAYDMSESKKGTTYYSSTTEGSRETNINNAGKTTYTATLSGDDTDSVMYACDYEFTVTSSGTALGKESISDIEVVFEGDIEKTIELSGSRKVKGTWFGFKKSNAEREFNAYLQLSNTNNEQNDLAGTNLSVEIKNTKWNCYLSEVIPAHVGDAYAILTLNQDNLNYTQYDMTFIRSETPIKVGDKYDNIEILEVYTGFETDKYSSTKSAPWMLKSQDWEAPIINVKFKDEIKPLSTAYWFSRFSEFEWDDMNIPLNIDLENLNTALVTDMSGMFAFTGHFIADNMVSVKGLNDIDISNVADMSHMFQSSFLSPDISNWDVSNVTDMSYMFNGFNNIVYDLDLSGWNVSSVENMEWMFAAAQLSDIGDITGWNTSSVTNMSSMFGSYASTTDDFYLDLSGWDVKNVVNYASFNYGVHGNGTIISPKWPQSGGYAD